MEALAHGGSPLLGRGPRTIHADNPSNPVALRCPRAACLPPLASLTAHDPGCGLHDSGLARASLVNVAP